MFLSQINNHRLHLPKFVAQVLGLKDIENIERQTGGQGFTFNADNKHIVKFAYSEKDLVLLQNTVALMKVLQPYLKDKTSIAVPNMEEFTLNIFNNGHTQQLYGVKYPILTGNVHHTSTFSKLPARTELMEQLGEFVGHLHEFPYQDYHELKVPSYKSALSKDLAGIVPLIKRRGPSFKAELMNSVCKELKLTQKPVLCHYDLSPRNICLNEDNTQITGVLDFGCAVIGSPKCEMMNAGYSVEDLHAFETGYNRVRQDTIMPVKTETPVSSLVSTVCRTYEIMRQR